MADARQIKVVFSLDEPDADGKSRREIMERKQIVVTFPAEEMPLIRDIPRLKSILDAIDGKAEPEKWLDAFNAHREAVAHVSERLIACGDMIARYCLDAAVNELQRETEAA